MYGSTNAWHSSRLLGVCPRVCRTSLESLHQKIIDMFLICLHAVETIYIFAGYSGFLILVLASPISCHALQAVICLLEQASFVLMSHVFHLLNSVFIKTLYILLKPFGKPTFIPLLRSCYGSRFFCLQFRYFSTGSGLLWRRRCPPGLFLSALQPGCQFS